MRKYLLKLLLNTFLLASAGIVAGCGGGGNNSAPVTATATVTVTVTTTVPAVSPPDTWIVRYALPPGNPFLSVTYGNGTFVAAGNNSIPVGYFGTILTSTDGITWTSRTSGTNPPLYVVTYGNGTFVAAGLGTILTSSD